MLSRQMNHAINPRVGSNRHKEELTQYNKSSDNIHHTQLPINRRQIKRAIIWWVHNLSFKRRSTLRTDRGKVNLSKFFLSIKHQKTYLYNLTNSAPHLQALKWWAGQTTWSCSFKKSKSGRASTPNMLIICKIRKSSELL